MSQIITIEITATAIEIAVTMMEVTAATAIEVTIIAICDMSKCRRALVGISSDATHQTQSLQRVISL